MTAALAFRGPDAQGIWSNEQAGFGHTLLRTTVESEAERQPFSFDQRAWIVADVRVDARTELISQLRSCGRPATLSTPDVELILQAYYVWGSESPKHLFGDYAFAIWDARSHELFCARDPFGIKQFYYARAGDAFLFGNTIDCLRRHPAISSALDEQAIGDFLLSDFNLHAGTTTFFKNIRALPPAHTLTLAEGELRLRRYWSVPQAEKIRYPRDEEYVEHFLEILRVAVADRLRGGTIGLMLSGGMDSGSVAALAHDDANHLSIASNLSVFTLDSRNIAPSRDPQFTKLLADQFHLSFHPHHLPDSFLHQVWEDSGWHLPEPVNDLFMLEQIDLLRAMAPVTRIALNGHLGDSLLFPARGYLVHLLLHRQWIQFASEVISFRQSHDRLPPLYLRSAVRERFSRRRRWHEYPTWLNPDFEARLNLRARWKAFVDSDDPVTAPAAERYEGAIYGHRLSYHALLDSGSTRVPIEPRSPFADLRLVHYLLAIPPLPWRVHKELLRRAMRGLLPEAVCSRPKELSPGASWRLLRQPNRWWLNGLKAAPELGEYVDVARVRRLFGTDDALSSPLLRVNLRPVTLGFWLGSNRRLDA